MSLSSGFLETECVGSLEFAKTKVFAQLSHAVTRNSKNLAVSGTNNDPGKLLRSVRHRTPSHCPRLSRVLATDSSSIHWGPTASMSSTCTPMQMSSSVFANKTRIAPILNGDRVLFNLLDRCSCRRLGDVRKTQDGLAHFSTPHVCHPSESSGSTLQVVAHAAVHLRGLQR